MMRLQTYVNGEAENYKEVKHWLYVFLARLLLTSHCNHAYEFHYNHDQTLVNM